MRRTATAKALVLGVSVIASLLGTSMAAQAAGSSGNNGRKPGACSATTNLASTACGFSVSDDYLVSVGKCTNISDPTDRADCNRDADVERRAAGQTCHAQFAARKDVCGLIGEARYDVQIDPVNFLDKAGIVAQPNPLFPLTPGKTYVYRNGDETVRTTVTNQTKQILGVTVIVINDVSTINGQLSEQTEDWYAQDVDGNVWYFGEIAQQFENGELVTMDGSWKAGVNGAQPGILMKGLPQVGDVYRQEFALADAEDMGLVLSVNGSATVPAASCKQTCLVTKDFSALEPDAIENKYYAPGYGVILVIDQVTGAREELIQVITN